LNEVSKLEACTPSAGCVGKVVEHQSIELSVEIEVGVVVLCLHLLG
jgi:hypothetical protein